MTDKKDRCQGGGRVKDINQLLLVTNQNFLLCLKSNLRGDLEAGADRAGQYIDCWLLGSSFSSCCCCQIITRNALLGGRQAAALQARERRSDQQLP